MFTFCARTETIGAKALVVEPNKTNGDGNKVYPDFRHFQIILNDIALLSISQNADKNRICLSKTLKEIRAKIRKTGRKNWEAEPFCLNGFFWKAKLIFLFVQLKILVRERFTL